MTKANLRWAALAATLTTAFAFAPGAHAAGAAPAWSVTSISSPTNLSANDGSGDQQIVLSVVNTGAGASEGPIAVTDALPVGVSLHGEGISGEDRFTQTPLSCEASSVSCSYSGRVDPGDQLRVDLVIDTAVGASEVLNGVSVSGGGAPGVSVGQHLPVSSTPAGFGVAPGSVFGALSTLQAGAHPNITAGFSLNQAALNKPARALRNMGVELPAGLIFNSTVVPECDMADVSTNTCPSDTAVGVATVTVDLAGEAHLLTALVYNIRPYTTEPDALAFSVVNVPIRLDVSVRTNGDYGVNASTRNLSEAAGLAGITVTLWGVPADHNGQSLPSGEPAPDTANNGVSLQRFGAVGGGVRLPLLSNPSICSEAISAALSLESWPSKVKGSELLAAAKATSTLSLGTPTGCGLLSFSAIFVLTPDTSQADAVSGDSNIELQVPQNENPDGLATPELQEVIASAPQGVTLNPAAADGLLACTAQDIDLASSAPGDCPAASQLGTVEIVTPLLHSPLKGFVYLAEPDCAPCTEVDARDGKLFRIYVEAQGSGTVIKLEETISANTSTGQLTVTFNNLPRQPFSAVRLAFEDGPHASFINPLACGPATIGADLTPYGAPLIPDVTPSSTFDVDWDGSGGACPASLPFTPAFGAETSYPNAGAFSPLTVTFSRPPRQQVLSRISVRTPPGLLGIVRGVPLCGEPEASRGTCAAASRIGSTTVAAGTGADPLWLSGTVYLTGPYEGAPYGLSIVVPAVAGPFNLGNVVVRATINVDQRTSQLIVTSDPLPQIVDGVVAHVQTVNVTIDRPHFTFNPTNCSAMAVEATLASVQGGVAQVSSPFAVGGCANLPFHPSFTVSTQGSASSRGNGASLDAKVALAPGEANIRSVAVTLPQPLPSRLTTIQHACPAAVFNQNPATCSVVSLIGTATASTPVLPRPLSGPAFLVSHGGAAFPDLDVILQGEGVTLILGGAINVSKTGITSSRFGSVPDAPVSSFELNLPEGPNSVLAAPSGNLCGKKLEMPTTITGQNGVQVQQNTIIAVTGCGSATKASRTRAKKARRARARKAKRARKAGAARKTSKGWPRSEASRANPQRGSAHANAHASAVLALAVPAVPDVSTGPATNVTYTTALITGTVNPEGSPSGYRFELGANTEYGTDFSGEAGSGSSELPITLALNSLAPATTYHYRLIASNQAGSAAGIDQTFATPAFPQSFTPPSISYPLLSGLAPVPPTNTPGEPSTTPTKKHKHKSKHKKSKAHKKQSRTTKAPK